MGLGLGVWPVSRGIRSFGMTPPGPVAEAFRDSNARVRAIMGPVGSGKTSTCLFEVIPRTLLQPISPIDGERHAKFAFVRDTYRNIEKTLLRSWLDWFPKTMGKFTGGGNDPSLHELRLILPQGGRDIALNIRVEFIALGDNSVEHVMRGWEGTGVYLNELDGLPEEVLSFVLGRCGRYPPKRHGGCGWHGVWADFNAPDTDSWVYKTFVEDKPADFEFFRQPSGLSNHAENKDKLPPRYYEDQMKNQPDWYVRRFIKNEFGYSRDGLPVYADEFADAMHVAATAIEPADLPIVVGADAGLTPAAVVGQQMPNGQWRVLDELCTRGMGARRFGEELARLLARGYRGLPATGWCDPAAAHGHDKEAGEASWIQIVSQVTGIAFKPAPTNKLIPRLEAVRLPLTRLIDGQQPGLLISPTCKVLRKGFNASYRYRRVQVGGGARYANEPDKTQEASHVHDGLQYMLSGGGEYHEVLGRKKGRVRRPYVATGYNLYA